ncbi:MAG: nuclear transport factor 2 family protein [Candidatus Thorarchaeota archaeon]|jgi:hypothetical protein
MNEKEAYAFCKEWLEAWTGNNPLGLIHFYSKDAFYSDPARKSGLKGHDEILPYFTKLLARNPNWKWRAKEIFPTKDGFILKWSAEIPVGNKIIYEDGMDIVEILQNKVKRNEVYFDRSTMLSEILGN